MYDCVTAQLYKLKQLKGAYIHWVPISIQKSCTTYIVDMGAYNHGMPIFYGCLLSTLYGNLKLFCIQVVKI